MDIPLFRWQEGVTNSLIKVIADEWETAASATDHAPEKIRNNLADGASSSVCARGLIQVWKNAAKAPTEIVECLKKSEMHKLAGKITEELEKFSPWPSDSPTAGIPGRRKRKKSTEEAELAPVIQRKKPAPVRGDRPARAPNASLTEKERGVLVSSASLRAL